MVENSNPKELFLAFWNFNFGTKQSKDQKIVDHVLDTYPDIQLVAGVETKVDDFREMFPSRFRVVQSLKSLSDRNVALAWARGSIRNLKIRGLRMGVDNRGVKMLPRKLRIIDFEVLRKRIDRYQKVRGIFGHRPPQRFKFLDPAFDASLKFRIKCRKHSRVGYWFVVADWNENGHAVAKKLGGTFHGYGIDGIICGPGVDVRELIIDRLPLKEGWTDHVGIVGKIFLR